MRTLCFTTLLVFLLSGCQFLDAFSDTDPPEATLGKPFWIEYEQTVPIVGTDDSITFAAVVMESRCPEGTECIWAGEAKIEVAATVDGERIGPIVLTLPGAPTTDEPTYLGLGPYEVAITDLTPEPRVNVVVEDEERRARLIVQP
ncbi:MAG: hypothetical protein RhofKO_24760 [Rhodothermales bacterium]